jgi:elongation factor P
MLPSLTFFLLLLLTTAVHVIAFVPHSKPSFGLVALHVAVDTSEIKNGMTLNIDNEPYKVLSFSVMKQARGAAKTTIKFKNLVSFVI